MRKLLSLTRKAITDYDMIRDGDKIAVGLSGGKDSIALLAVLAEYRKFSPQKFDLIAVNVDLGWGVDPDQVRSVQSYCDAIDVPFVVEKTEIAQIIEIREEKSPCSLCSKMRRGALNGVANRCGCNKLALGHHADDLAETLLLSLIYEGRFSTFMPISLMERSGITLIRPFLYVEEKYLSGFARRYALPIIDNPCPKDKHTKRQDVKELLSALDARFPDAKSHILTAIYHPERNNLFPLRRPHDDGNGVSG